MVDLAAVGEGELAVGEPPVHEAPPSATTMVIAIRHASGSLMSTEVYVVSKPR
jgi:hypothetical protein